MAKQIKEDGDVDINFKMPSLFLETRFTNYARRLYIGFPAIIRTLDKAHLEKWGGNSEDRKKAATASELSNKIFNKRFVILLSGKCDIYEVFGHGVNILQMVNMLYVCMYVCNK